MRKVITLLLAAAFTIVPLTLTACGESENIDDYNWEKYVEICEYKGISATRKQITINQDDIDDEIEDFLDDLATEKKLTEEDVLALGDTVNINYVGYIVGDYEKYKDGEKFTEYDDVKGYDLTLGSGSFISGFESGLVGHHVGEKVSVEVTFPTPYKNNPDLEGVKALFLVTINSATRDILPEYNDELVAANTDYDTVEEFEAYLWEKLEAEAEEDELTNLVSDIWKYIVDNSTVKKYPDKVVESYKNNYIASYTNYAKQYNLTLNDFLEKYLNTTKDEFEKQVTEQAKTYVVEEMLLRIIVKREGIKLTEDEFKTGAEKYAKDNGFEDAEALIEYYGEDTVRQSLLWDKVMLFLVDNANVTDAPDTSANTETQ